MKRIGVITVGRSDYGIYRPVLQRIHEDPELELMLYVSGSHLSPEFGMTVDEIRTDGFPIVHEIEMLSSSDSPQGIGKSMGAATTGFAQALSSDRPDILMILGDRFEMFGAAVAALPYAIPMAHIHGGESTEGLIDEQIRHALTKMSHIHFATTQTYADRIVQMGEEPWRVTVSGAPSLDQLGTITYLSDDELSQRIGMPLTPAPLLVTVHPVTLEFGDTERHIAEVLDALDRSRHPVVFTYPNSDTRGRIIIEAIKSYVDDHDNARVAVHLGTQAFFSLMRTAIAMVGNSSSGIIEAASFKLPVVNVGNRQKGRISGHNVVHTSPGTEDILSGICKAVSPSFNEGLNGLVNPYGDGHAAERITSRLKTVICNTTLIQKRFHDQPNQREQPCESCSSEPSTSAITA